MKPTANESSNLKQRFKQWFQLHGINAALPPDLESERQAFPTEWAEACHEYDNKL